jgi:hypothetical protein
MTYRAKKGSGISHKVANVVALEMTRLDPEGDGITAHALHISQKPIDMPLHSEFEWRDDFAGSLYRDSQARGLLRCVFLVSDDEEGTPAYEGRAFLAIKAEATDDEDGDDECAKVYKPALLVLKDENLSTQVIDDALRQLKGWRDRWHSYSEVATRLQKVISAIDEVFEQ